MLIPWLIISITLELLDVKKLPVVFFRSYLGLSDVNLSGADNICVFSSLTYIKPVV